MDFIAMFNGIKDGTMKVHSDLGTRDENRQSGNFGARIKKMKTVTGINSRILLMKDLVIPFNPVTCEIDSEYNNKSPFRPIMLVSDSIKFIKNICAQDEELYAKWKNILNGELDLSKPNEVSIDEYVKFRSCGFIKPRIMSYYTVRTNFNGESGMPEYQAKYMVNPKDLNDEGSYDMDKAPIHHMGAVFFNSILRPEAQAREEELKKSGAPKQTIKDEKRTIYGKSPLGFVSVTNLVPFIYIPFSADIPNITEDNLNALLEHIQYYSYTEKFAGAFSKLEDKPARDNLIDFYDLTVTTPAANKTKISGEVYTDEDVNAIYQALSITLTDLDESIMSGYNKDGVPYAELYKNLLESASAYFLKNQEESVNDPKQSFETIMSKSNKFRPIESIQDKLLPACNEVFNNRFASSEYFTDKVKMANQDFFALMNPDNVHLLAEFDDDEIDEAREEQKADISKLIEDISDSSDDTQDISIEESVDDNDNSSDELIME